MMNKTIFLLVVFMTFGSDAGGAIESEYDFDTPSKNHYFVVNVDKSEITDNSVIRLKMNVQFDDNGYSELLNTMSEVLEAKLSNTEAEKSGYLITIKLPIAKNWRQYGKRLKVRITADTDLPNQPNKQE